MFALRVILVGSFLLAISALHRVDLKGPKRHLVADQIEPSAATMAKVRTLITQFDSAPLSEGSSPWTILHRAYASSTDFELVGVDGRLSFSDWLSTHVEPDAPAVYRGVPLMSNHAAGCEMTQHVGGLSHRGFESHYGQFLFLISRSAANWTSSSSRLSPGTCRRLSECSLGFRGQCFEYIDPTFVILVLLTIEPDDSAWKDACGHVWSIDRLAHNLVQKSGGRSPCHGAHRLLAVSTIADSDHRALISKTRTQAAELRTSAKADLIERWQSINFSRFRENPERDVWYEQVLDIGHTLEWLLVAEMDINPVEARTVEEALECLVVLMERIPPDCEDFEYGAICHAIRALRALDR